MQGATIKIPIEIQVQELIIKMLTNISVIVY
jgi:hypothetical protein